MSNEQMIKGLRTGSRMILLGWMTSHNDGPNYAVYVTFGKAFGWIQNSSGGYMLSDVHGAGAQRSDPKTGNPDDYPYGHGPQGDVVRIYNYVRCVNSGT